MRFARQSTEPRNGQANHEIRQTRKNEPLTNGTLPTPPVGTSVGRSSRRTQGSCATPDALQAAGEARRSHPRPPTATLKPPQSHLQAIYCGVQSHPKATPRPPQSHPKATPRPPQSPLKATPRLSQGHPTARYKPAEGVTGFWIIEAGCWILAAGPFGVGEECITSLNSRTV
jgi:hypothetical protein